MGTKPIHRKHRYNPCADQLPYRLILGVGEQYQQVLQLPFGHVLVDVVPNGHGFVSKVS